MKLYKTILFVLFASFVIAQNDVNYRITGMIFKAKFSKITLAQQTPTGFITLSESTLDKDGNFEMKGVVPAEDYYVVTLGDDHRLNVIIRKNSDFKIYGDGSKLDKFCNIVGSEESDNLTKFAFELDKWNNKKDSAVAIIQQDNSKAQQVNADMQNAFNEFQSKYQTFIGVNMSSPALIAALSATDPSADFDSYENIVLQLNASFGHSPTVKRVMDDYSKFKAQKEAQNILAPGKQAPDFKELMLDRTTSMSLSDLKGKVVLLDFWASWCGPCRKENPNVVKLYEKYKDRGFTVMSVSLDDNLQRWQQAIDADKLVWPYHVSDLKKWSSAAAKLYGVSGIPFTVLIDKDGKIVQTNLRGPQLEQALEQLLGK